jgi:phosphoesterase RecJ-like protein
MNNIITKIIKLLSSQKNFLITAHTSLDGDAVGAELALYSLLRLMKKNVVVCNTDALPQAYKFLPYADNIQTIFNHEIVDTAIVVDCSDPERIGRAKEYLARARHIINIDHHISNAYFGDINWVEPQAGSVSQILYKLFKRMKRFNKDIALCLYTGIITDTGHFSFSNVTSDTHAVVSDLLHYGIKPDLVHENLHSLCDAADLRFIGEKISAVKFAVKGKVCWIRAKHWKDKEFDLTEVIFSIMRMLKGVEVFLIFKQLEGKKIRVNFRSRSMVDVNAVAAIFGGGGHKRAGGATIEGEQEQVEAKVIAYLEKIMNECK